MINEFLQFLTSNRIGVISILTDTGPHAATVHYSLRTDNLEIYFATSTKSKKCAPLMRGEAIPASFVVGFNEDKCITFQSDGLAQLVTNHTERESIIEKHYGKFPNHGKYKSDPQTAIIKFTANWYRFSDFNQEPPNIIENSDWTN